MNDAQEYLLIPKKQWDEFKSQVDDVVQQDVLHVEEKHAIVICLTQDEIQKLK